jgi:hypothetical protein
MKTKQLLQNLNSNTILATCKVDDSLNKQFYLVVNVVDVSYEHVS